MKIVFVLAIVACALTQTFGFRLRPRHYGRIVGGEDATIEDIPHQLSYQYFKIHICGASVLSKKSALTAAHCTDDFNYRVSVRAGSNIMESGGEEVDVAEVRQHPKYAAGTTDYDISVLLLDAELDLGTTVAIINLQPINQEPAEGAEALVSGWGAVSENGDESTILQKVVVNHVSRSECNTVYNGRITDRMICYGAPNKDSCQGDSGGPLVGGDKQIGIVSWGRGCARPGVPGVYTNVANAEIHDYITANKM
ncbi:hypothetical protein FQR65_LT10768 [Abscondita terminalis]|nr:hypothetical protein FQR65_LT10768 [Abscondita terminalis]